ncbi:hypothetical protein EYZ11_006766 [Aspergillus tanneri]|uniref:DUF7732 domain-containing protein n=1 Tax=Aspergillus tanneri TaxID=1220188 RepID=A0A4S3JH35_9EURO|nr:uncharacterized protein ATNIH1004_006968 [Aspergillus tanneri]KAA8645549.1 hypothetical protein ATNIH1004_006968 [Aspergillus tanneri]THC93758.1 hypothetical protein EYZ11_006766 [Aspergillus tanneri]
MKISSTATFLAILLTSVTSLGIPRSDLALREPVLPSISLETPDLEKRRGGGGFGGGGGRGGGGSGRSGGGSGGRSGSSSGGSRSSSSSTSSSSNRGGTTRGGSGPRPAYGGGNYYAGGARTPYAAGRRSPLGVAPFLLPVAALAFFPGIWLYGAYAYPYTHHYNYTDERTRRNESLPVVCLCEKYAECGCDDNSSQMYYESLFNGTQPSNSSMVKVVEVNSTRTIYINGTLPNGTTVDDPSTTEASGAPIIQAGGYWMMAVLIARTVWGL